MNNVYSYNIIIDPKKITMDQLNTYDNNILSMIADQIPPRSVSVSGLSKEMMIEKIFKTIDLRYRTLNEITGKTFINQPFTVEIKKT